MSVQPASASANAPKPLVSLPSPPAQRPRGIDNLISGSGSAVSIKINVREITNCSKEDVVGWFLILGGSFFLSFVGWFVPDLGAIYLFCLLSVTIVVLFVVLVMWGISWLFSGSDRSNEF
jgi:hypothetical protein